MAKIIAVVSAEKDIIAGGAPIFIAGSQDECQTLALALEKIIDAAAHLLPNGVMILVDHDTEKN